MLLPWKSVILTLYLFQFCHSKSEYTEDRPTKSIPVTTGSSHFNMELNYPNAFEVTIESYNSQQGQTGFCHTFPSRIATKPLWTGPIQFLSKLSKDTEDILEENIEHYYDNIGYYKEYYFLLDSVTFEVTAVKNLTDRDSYITIPSDFQNDFEEGRPEDAYLVVDAEVDLLFIVTRKYLYMYDLFNFMVEKDKGKKNIPHIKDKVEGYGPYNDLISVKFYSSRLFVVADNIVDVYAIDDYNNIKKEIQLNNEYFGTNKVSITSITFKGNYIFVLDNFRGVYLIDISSLNSPDEKELKRKYRFQIKAILEIIDGQFIEIVGNTLQVILKSTKIPVLREYIIVGDPIFSHYILNRQADLYQSVMDTYADNNFFFILTGYFNMVSKFGILGKYNSTDVEDHLMDYWPIFGTKAVVSVPSSSGSSKLVAVHDNYITMLRVYQRNPVISCDMQGVQEGIHRYKVKAMLKECQEKIRDRRSSYDSVCVINQEIELSVIKEDADIGSTKEKKMTILFLVVGIGAMFLMVVVFGCLWRKYKRQVLQLEDEIKFQKLEEEPEGQSGEKKIRGQEIELEANQNKK